MSQKKTCFVCDKGGKNATNIFVEQPTIGKPLVELLSDILDKPLTSQNVYSNQICTRCKNICTEYNSVKLSLGVWKAELLYLFKSTLLKHGLKYDTFETETQPQEKTIPKAVTDMKSQTKIVVLPASKLQPLPPDYVLSNGKLLADYHSTQPTTKVSTVRSIAPSTLNLKVTVGTSVLTQSIKTTRTRSSTHTTQIQKLPTTQASLIKLNNSKNVTNALTNMLNSKANNSIMGFNIGSLPLLTNSVLKSDENLKSQPVNNDISNGDVQKMEIDNECTVVRVSDENILIDDVEKDSENQNSKLQYFDVSLVAEDGDGVQEDADGDDYQETIVMAGDDASILRVVSGQKLLYENGELSLVVPEDEQNDDGQDSNDESQIELQVSGDEETANAIIAAAQEQGGAFIKVESGEMFRVQSIQSKTENREEVEIQPIVAQEGEQFKCLLCERITDPLSSTSFVDGAAAVMSHMRSEHNARLYICELCGKIIRKRTDYTAHIEEHGKPKKSLENKNRIHECSVCTKRFSCRAMLEEHKNVHSGARPYTCNICEKSYSSKYTFQTHLKIHWDRPRPFKCKECPKTFLTAQNLAQHEKTHLGIKDFVCNLCNKAFGTQHNLEVHGVVHSGNKPYVCGVCEKTFARRAEVRDHMRTHTGERPFSCDTCGAMFAQRSNLHSHRRATHMDDKRYQCTICPKKFKRRRLLEYHVKASHTGERPLQCAACRATFVYPEHYKKHMRIHSGERPFSCEVCGKTFTSRDNRNTHRFVHSDKKPYECLVCGVGYMRKQLLYTHMNTSGHIAESIVVNQPRVQKVVEEGHITEVNQPRVQKVVEEVPADAEEINDNRQTIFVDGQDYHIEGVVERSIPTADDNSPKIFITNIANDKQIILQNGSVVMAKDDANTLLEESTIDPLAEQAQLVAADNSLGMYRLVQIELQSGSTGWVLNGE